MSLPESAHRRRRATWTVLDQAVSSLTNFAISLAILKLAGLEDFGAFSIAYLAYQFAIVTLRSLVGEPLTIRFAAKSKTVRDQSIPSALGTASLLGLGASVLAIVVSAWAERSLQTALLTVGLVAPGLLLQDTARYAFFAAGRPRRAFFNDLAWLVAEVAVVLVALQSSRPSFGFLVGAWAVSGAFAGVVGVFQLQAIPSFGASWFWLKEHGKIGRDLLGDVVVARASGSIALIGVGLVAGLQDIGAINGARVMFGPVTMLYLGTSAFAVPEGVKLLKVDQPSFLWLIKRLAIILPVVAVIWGATLMLISDAFIEWLIGTSWSQIMGVIAPVAIWTAAEGIITANRSGLQAASDTRSILVVRSLSAPLVIGLALLGAGLAGAVGASWGLAIALAVSSILWIRTFSYSHYSVDTG